MTDYGVLLEPLLEELDLDYEGLHVVAIGGGHGLAQALMALQDYADVITAVVTVADDGGSSGRLAPDLGIPPPGDIRRALLALSPEDSVWRDLVGHRFEAGDVAGHSLGNLIIAALTAQVADFDEAVAIVARHLQARGEVVPVAPVALNLEATIDGRPVRGQVAVATTPGRLTDLRVTPEDVEASPAALRAIDAADQIVLGPGSLFTSIAVNLKVPGMVEAVNASPAKLVYVCNLATQNAETLGMDAADHVEALIEVTGVRRPDTVVAHDDEIVGLEPPIEPVRVDGERLAALGCTVELARLCTGIGPHPHHDPARLGAVLRRLA
ncbi:MAG TPA: uridine diphosphate-N-acetylglucosamine-binding protein YvcK [Acidimicrobiia bacterium]|nr:uridine diphosphate-N-acetylglucosamine-binding protein YvcK [Acidimicrobiia bacterium]